MVGEEVDMMILLARKCTSMYFYHYSKSKIVGGSAHIYLPAPIMLCHIMTSTAKYQI